MHTSRLRSFVLSYVRHWALGGHVFVQWEQANSCGAASAAFQSHPFSRKHFAHIDLRQTPNFTLRQGTSGTMSTERAQTWQKRLGVALE
jgi:hypothetical protein